MLQNAYLLAKIGGDTAENEQHFAEILPKIGNYPTGPPGLGGSKARPPVHDGGRQPPGLPAEGPAPEGPRVSAAAQQLFQTNSAGYFYGLEYVLQ